MAGVDASLAGAGRHSRSDVDVGADEMAPGVTRSSYAPVADAATVSTGCRCC